MSGTGNAFSPEEGERFALIAQHTRNIVIFTDEQSRITWVNNAFSQITGYSRKEAMGRDPSFLQGEGTDPKTVARIRRALDRGESIREEILNFKKTGESYWVDLEILPQKNQKGTVVGFMALQTDITNRKRREESLHNFRSAVEQCTALIIITNAAGLIEYVNPAFEQNTGYQRAEILGQTPAILRSGQHTVEFYSTLWKNISQGRIWRGIFQNRRKDGSIRAMAASIAPVFDEKMRIVRYISVQEDITERQDLENHLRSATVQAEAANRAKSAFLATMSHEIRTPLNAIIGMASLLDESRIEPDLKEHVRTIVSSSETLLELINDVLDYSKLESLRVELVCQPVRVEDLLLEPMEIFVMAAVKKGIELSHFLDPRLPEVVLADKARIKQILINLLSNAIKFTKKGEVTLSARAVEGSEHPQIEFQVKDSGIGIAPDAQQRLFEPFSQADSSITREFGGTGLGLVISKRLVNLMKGSEIQIDSQPGKGSTFSFCLPLPPATIPEPSSIDISCLQGKRMLIVDDIEVNRKLLQAFGFQWGMTTLEADCAGAALGILEQDPGIDVIVLDFQMPGIDGEALAEKIRAMPSQSSIPRIMVSSLPVTTASFQQGLFHSVLQKPLRTTRLKEVLVKLLGAPDSGNGAKTAQGEEPLGFQILVAEDNPNNQAVLRLMFRKMGCEAVMVSNGSDALKALEEQRFDIVILDVQMPVMDGITAARNIRKVYPKKAERPALVALTANAFPEDEQTCLEAGFDLYLAKPVDYATFRKVLQQFSTRRR